MVGFEATSYQPRLKLTGDATPRKRMQSYFEIPEDLIVSILSRLPVKTVGRCRCVSKSWQSLLSRPDFIRTHISQSRNLRPESLFFVSVSTYEHSKPEKVHHPFYYASLSNACHLFDKTIISPKRLKFSTELDYLILVFGSCDGLVLVGHYNLDMFVLNPIINEVREVPIHPLDPDGLMYAFGYDSVSDDYKIVTTSYIFDAEDTELYINVFSLKTGAWKKSESAPHNFADFQLTNVVFVDGCIHWLGLTISGKPTIVAFDLAQEKFHEIAIPSPDPLDDHFTDSLVTLGGCLCTFDKESKEIWVMKEYGVQESWTKLTIDDPNVVKTKPICMWGKEQVVFMDRHKLILYNLEEDDGGEERVKDILIKRIRGLGLPFTTSFVESLVSPHL